MKMYSRPFFHFSSLGQGLRVLTWDKIKHKEDV